MTTKKDKRTNNDQEN